MKPSAWFSGLLSLGVLVLSGSSSSISQRQNLLQDIITLDEHSLLIRGERLFIYSGEFHPFRLPVPGLWLDVFQKIKALGFNGVSFYVDWGLVEGEPGVVNLEGIFDLKPFFEAASEAGLYLIARPGPYINAETAAGGFPGWVLRIGCVLRSTCPEYENATKEYMATIGRVIADAQITNGGPIILVQPENEYSTYPNVSAAEFPDQMNREYMAFIEQELRSAGIVVPFIDNDNEVRGSFAPHTGLGAVDVYGIDAYPMRYDCGDPDIWPTYEWPTNWQTTHEEESPSTPFAIPELQGGSITSWGGVSQDMCGALVGPETVRVVYKNNYSFGVKLFNIYMTYGGTNWGNLGYMGGDSSYDYGAAINEYRQVWREKYSEEKLQANFFRVSPAYLTSKAGNLTNGAYANTMAVGTTPLYGEQGTNFYVVRQANYTSLSDVFYSITLSTSMGNVTIPQLGGRLSLLGRDSKMMVTNYDIGGATLVYSSADIFNWAKSTTGKTVLIMYGTDRELHEFAVRASTRQDPSSSHASVKMEQWGTTDWIVQWSVTPEQQTVYFDDGDLEIRLLWRNDAYNYWALELPADDPVGNFSSPSKSSVIVKAGYLMRTASIQGRELQLTGDFNATTNLELVFEPTGQVNAMTVNGMPMRCISNRGHLLGSVNFTQPSILLPDFLQSSWKAIDSLPEIQADYDDSLWTACDHNSSTNNQVSLQTPTSLYASDYGYHTGSLLYRGHFTATEQEISLFLNVSGGLAFSNSVFLNSTFVGSWAGSPNDQTHAQMIAFPANLMTAGQHYVLTVVIDHMGQTEEAPGTDTIKFPIGILDYSLSGHEARDVAWKMTGNLGGELYRDKSRGPPNEGAMFAERQGYHRPKPPSGNWTESNPISDGLIGPGVAFDTTSFDLTVPGGYDVPMAFVFANNSGATGSYRVQLFVNGYQFGKFIPYFGPVFAFPVPEGILNYNGTNTVALTLWALDSPLCLRTVSQYTGRGWAG